MQWDPVPSLTVRGGRIANPYFATDLVWAADLTFDGAAITYRPRLSPSWNAFTTIFGGPILTTTASSGIDSWNEWLYAGQIGLEAGWTDRSSFKFGVAYYDFVNMQGRLNPFDTNLYGNSVPLFRKGGN